MGRHKGLPLQVCAFAKSGDSPGHERSCHPLDHDCSREGTGTGAPRLGFIATLLDLGCILISIHPEGCLAQGHAP